MSFRRNLATLAAWLLVVLSLLLPGSALAQAKVHLLPSDSALIPDGVGPEDEFRLLFVTDSTRDGSSGNISHYNNHVQQQAGRRNLASLIREHASHYRVVGSTGTVSARNNTNMTGNGGPPIYWVNGDKVADNYGDFYDGTWDSYNWVTQTGQGRTDSNSVVVYTGSKNDGSIAARHLGSMFVNSAKLTRSGSTGGVEGSPLAGSNDGSGTPLRFYGISPIFKVKRPITISATPPSAKEGAQRTLTVSTTGGAHSEARTIKVKFIDDPDFDFLPAELEEFKGESLREIEIKAGAATTTFDFKTHLDPWTDKSGKFKVEISESFGGQPEDLEYGDGGKHSVDFTVTNDPAKSHPKVSLSAALLPGGRTNYQEGVDPGVFYWVTLDKPWPNDAPLKVYIRAFDDKTSNFLLPSEERTKTVQFAKGDDSERLEINMIADGTKSNDGEITAEVVGGSSTLRGSDADDPRELASHTVKILNNDDLDDRVVSVVDAELTVNEGGQAVFTLEVDQAPADGALVVADFITDAAELSRLLGRTVPAVATPQTEREAERSPVAGADFTRPVGGTIYWPSGKTRATLTIPIVDDMPYEGDEVFGVKFRDPSGVTFEGTKELYAFATINDDADTPVLTANSPSADEGNTDRDSGGTRNTLDYTFTLSTTSTLPVQFLVRDTLTGTADSKDETDVDAVPDTTLVIPAGDRTVTHKVTINGDTDVESDETVVLRLSQPRNAHFPNKARTLDATGTITDDDGSGEPRTIVRLLSPNVVAEGETVRFHIEVIDSVSREPVAMDKDCEIHFNPYSIQPPVAILDGDYTPGVVKNVPIAKGSSSSAVLEMQIIQDDKAEVDKVILFGLDQTGNTCPRVWRGLPGYEMPVPVTITDATLVDIEDPAEKVTEGQHLVFPVRLTSAQSSDVSVNWITVDGSAKSAADYRDYWGAQGTFTFKAGETEGTIQVRTLQDKVDEPDQDFKVRIYGPTSLTIRRDRATGVIRDDDARPDISIGDVTVTEGATANFTVELSTTSEKKVTAAWVTQDGTAVARTDYEHASGAVTFAPGRTEASISVKTLDDARDEATETFTVSLFDTPEGKRKIADATVTIEDNDDAALTFSVSDAHAEVKEVAGGSTATFTVTLSEEARSAASVDWKTQDGEGFTGAVAMDGLVSDYTAVSATTLTFAPGETEKQVSVTVVDDETTEGKEHFRVVLENPSGATIERSTGVAYIAPNDGVIYTVVNAGAEIPEGQSFVARVRRDIATAEHTVRFCLRGVNSDNPFGTALISNPDTDPGFGTPSADNNLGKDDVRVTTRYSQYNDCLIRGEPGAIPLITYAVGEYEKTVTIHTINDTRFEDDETFMLADGSGGNIYGGGGTRLGVAVHPSGMFTILDDESRRISVKARRSTVWEGEKTAFDIHLDPPLAQGETASVKYSTTDGTATGGPAAEGHDYAAHTDATLTLGPPQQAGGPAGTIEVQAHNEPVSESVYEQAETFTITLSEPSDKVNLPTGGAHVMTVTILDDDPTTAYADHAVADEGDKARVAIRLSHPRDADAEVTWATREVEGGAEAGKDFTTVAAGTVTVPAGKTIVYVEVATLEDELIEGDESFEVAVTKVDLPDFIYGEARTVTIRDDDRHAPMFTGFEDVSVEENEDWSVDPTLEGEPDGVMTWTLAGDDAAVFRINKRNGRLRLAAQNFEAPEDKDAKSTYEVTVRATDEDGNTGTEDLTVTVTDVRTVQVRPVEGQSGQEGNSVVFNLIRTGTTQHTTAASLKWRTLPDSEGDHPAVANDYTRQTQLKTHQIQLKTVDNLLLPTTDDDIDEEDETFLVELSQLSDGATDDAVFVDTEGNILPSPIKVVVTIRDDDTRGVTIDPVEIAIDEVDDPSTNSDTENEAAYTVVLKSRPTGQVAIDLGVPDGAPFTVSPNKVTFKAKDWETAQTVTVTAVDDTIDNPDGERSAEITHTLDAAETDYADETPSAVSVTVADNDAAPDGITLTVDTDTIAEDAATATVTVTATVDGGTTFGEDKTVRVEVGAGTDSAVEGTDYANVAGFDLVITAGATSVEKTFELDPTDNAVDADDKSLSITGTSGDIAITPASIAITDDDDAPVLSINAPSVAEGANGATATLRFTVTLTPASGRAVTVDYAGQSGGTATSGGDYLALTAGTLSFAAGEVSKTIDVTVNGDDTDEPDETLLVRLSSPSNATFAGAVTTLDGTGTITDDDATSLILARTGSGSIAEDGGSTEITLTLGRALVAGESVTVPLTVTGGTVATHYQFGLKGNGGTGVSLVTADPHSAQDPAVTLSSAGAQTATLTLTAVANTDIVRRTIEIAYGGGARAPPSNALSGGINATGSATVPIKDDDAMIGVAAASAAEGSAVAFTVTLPEAAPAGGVTIGYSTSDGRGKADDASYQVATSADYTAAAENASLSIAEGASTGTISIATTDDATYESDHYFTLTLDNTSLYNISSQTDGAAVGTITDADDTPSFAFSAASTDADEDDGTVTFDVAKTGATLVDATVSYATVDGSAAGGSDFTAIASTDLDFTAADTSKSISVTLTDDSNDEPQEAFSVALTAKSHAKLGSTSSHTVNITDNDATRVTLAAPAGAINENGGAKTITVTLGRTLTGDESLDVPLTFAGTATFGADYTLAEPSSAPTGVTYSNLASTDLAATPPTVSFSGVDSAASSATLILTAAADTVDEGASESVTVGLGTLDANSGSNLDGGASGSGTASFNIRDDDSRGISVSPVTLTLAEVDDPLTESITEHQKTYSIELDSQPTGTVTVSLSSGDTTVATLSDNSLEFTASDWDAQTVTVTAVADDIDNAGDERTVRITHTVSATGTDYEDETAAAVDVTVTDDDGAPTLSIDSPSVAEGDSSTVTMTFKVTLTPASGKPVSVAYADAATGTATSATDYAAISSGTLNFAAGETEKTVTVTVNGDTTHESNETVVLRLSSPSNATLSGGAQTLDGTGTITDDDDAPTVSVADATAVNEGNDPKKTVDMSFTVNLSEASSLVVTVPYTLTGTATGGSDYETPASTSLAIAAGDTSGTIVVKVKGDTLDEPDETIIVTLGAPTNATVSTVEGAGAGTGTITDDDDAPTLSIDSPSVGEGDKGSADLSFKVTLTPASGMPVTVNYADAATGTATSGEDYAAIKAGILKFAAGETSKKVAVSVTGDTTDEPDESVVLRLSAPTNAVFAEAATTIDGEGTITDDDDGPTVAISAATDVTEGDDPATTVDMSFTVLLNAVSGKDVTVPFALSGTATAGEDYENPDPLAVTIPAGKVQAELAVAVKGDTVHEGRETIIVQLKTPTNATLSKNATKTAAKGGILDDEKLPVLSLALDPTTIDESGDDNASTVTARLSGASSQDVTLNVAAAPVDPAVVGDYALSTNKTLTIAAGSKTSTGTVTITAVDNEVDAPNKSVTVSAKATGGNGIASPGDATLKIRDDDAAPTVSVADATAVREGNDPDTTADMSFTVSLSAASANAVTVPYTLTGTATGGNDYETPSSTSLSIAAGDTSGTIVVKVKGDTVDEPNETIIATLGAPTNATVSTVEGAGTGTGTITDDDGTPVVTLKLTPATIGESGDDNATTVTASMRGPSSQAVTLTVTAAAVSPAAAGDFALSENTTLTIAAGSTTSTGAVTVTAVDNDVDAANKTVTVSATATGGNGVAKPADATLTITDDDERGISVSPVTLTLAEADDPLTESATEHQKTYTVELDSQPTGNVTVNLSSGDTTIATLSDNSLEFTASDWDAQTVTVTAVADNIDNAGDKRAVRITHTVSAAGTDYKDETAAAVDVTVTDDDGEPTLSIDSPSVAEGDSSTATMTFKVTLSPASGKPVSVAYADATTGTATSATDYAAIADGTLSFAAGQTEKTVAVTVNGDTVDEPNETVVLRLSSPSNAALSGGAETLDGTGTINDDDATPTATLVLTPATIDESGNKNESTVTATLSGASSEAVTLTIAAAAVSPAVTGDFTLSASKTLTIAAGSKASAGAVTITAVDNSVDAPNKSVTVSATSSGGGVADPDDATLTITDDDTRGVTVSTATLSVDEADDSDTPAKEHEATYTVVLGSEPTDDVQIDLTAPSMVTLSTARLTFTPSNWNIAQTVTATAVDDAVDNTGNARTGNIIHTVVAGDSDYDGVTAASVAVTVNDDDTAPEGIALTVDEDEVAEDAGKTSITVTATVRGATRYAAAMTVTVTVGKSTDSAESGTDYAAVTAFDLELGAGEASVSKAFDLTPTDDALDETDETISVTGESGTLSVTGASITLTDDDTRGIRVAPVALTLAEADDPLTESISEHQKTYSIELDTQPTGTVTVNLSSGDTKIATLSETSLQFTISDWDAQTVTVTAVADNIDNAGDERTVRITHTVSAADTDYKDETAAAVDVTVTDDDGEPTLSIDAPSVAEGDSSTATLTFKVTLTPASGKPVSVAYADATTGTAASATDYAAITGGTLSFAAGKTEKTVDVTVNGDTIDEPNETVVLRLSSPSNAVLSGGKATLDGTGTINDDDGTPTVTLKLTPTTIAESGDDNSSTVTASLSSASSQAVTLTVAATAVSPAVAGDFTLSGTTLTIAAGSTESTGTVTVTAVDNEVDAANKTVTVSATASGGNGVADPADATLTITDNDERGIRVSPVALTLAEVDDPLTESATEHQKTYSIELDSQPTGTVTVNLSSGDTKIATLSDTSLEFTTSDWDAQTVTVTAVADAIDNAGDKRTVRITHTVSAAGTDYKDETAAAVDVTVTDDDGEPTLSIDSPSVAEGNSSTATLTFKVTLSPASGKPVSVTYADATTGTATSATDYAAITGGTLNFAVGDTEKTVDVTVNGDTVDEPNETVVLRLSSPSNAALSGGAETLDGTGRITDDDDAPTVSVANATAVNEGNDPKKTVDMSFTVTLSEASSLAVTVPYTLTGTATGGSDYETPASTSLSIAAGGTSGTIVVKVKGDTLDEPNETIVVTLGAPTNATVSTVEGAGTGTGTITDDDGTPAVTLKLTPTTIAESGDDNASTITASLSSASSQDVTLTVAATAVDPATSSDFTLSGTTLTIAAGATESTGTVTITAVDNDVDAANKTVTVSATATGGNSVADPADATLTITDDDDRGISVSPVTLTLDEVDDPLTESATEHQKTYSIELDSQPTGTVTVNLSSGDTKIATLSDTSLEFTTSDWDAQTVTVTAVADDIDNAGDVRTVRITHTVSATATDYEDETAAAVDVTVTDDDGEPTLSIDAPSVAEGNSSTATMTFKVTLSPASGKPVSVAYADATTGTAASATDYAAIADGTLNFAAGQTEKTVDVTVNGDTVDEPNETVVLRLSSPSNAVLTGGAETLDGTGTINDDDATPTATLVLTPATIGESGNRNESTVTATLSGTSSEAVTLTVAAAAVSPAVTGDFTLSTNKTLTIAAGSKASTGAVTITAVDNSVDAPNKSVTVSATASGGGAADPDDATLTITDDDTRGVTVAGGALTMDEADNAGTEGTREDQDSYTVVLDSEPTDDVQIDLGAPAMVTLSATSLTFTPANWNQAQTVTVTAVNDSIDNAGDERTGSIAHTMVAGESDYGGVAVTDVAVTVNDDDGEPTLSIDAPSVDEGDSTTTTLTFKVTLSPASGKPVSVAYADAATGTATSATDYAAISSGTLNFAAGDTEETVAVTVNGDTVDEPHETVVLRLSSPSNAALSGGAQTLDGTGTITDDDDAPTVSVANATAVNEGNDPKKTVDMSFTVTLSEASSLAVTVPYTLTGTATSGSDYETPASTSLAIPAGDTSGTIVVKVKGDALDEPNETIIVTLGTPTNATVSTVEGAGTGTGTITDDDGTPAVTLKLTPTTIDESGDDNASTVTASLSSASSQAVTLTVAAAAVDPATSSDFTLGGTTLTIAAGATESTGSVTITAVDNDVDSANKTVTVSATATGGNGVANPADATLTVTDDDTRGVTVTGGTLTMDEADKAGTQDTREDQDSYTVVLDSEPTDDVRIDLAAPAMVTLSPTSLTFTPANWNQAQTVTATAVDDAIDNAGNERTGNITHAVVEGDSDYAGVAAASVAVTVNDDDGTPTLTLDLDPASIAESGDGNSTTVTASLSGASSQAVALTVAASAVSPAAAGDFTLSGTILTIAAGATESTGAVTITAVDNDVDAANKTVTVSATVTGGNGVAKPAAVTLTITDDDTRGISVSPVSLTLAEADNPSTQNTSEHQKTYSVELDSQPTGTVTVNLSSGNTDIATLSETSLEFTASDWDAQTVTVTAVADDIDNAGDARTVRITHTVSATGTDYEDETAAVVDVTVNDDDDAPDGITLSVNTDEVAEDAGKTSVIVTATVGGGTRYSADTTVEVTVGKATDSAVSGTDFARVSAFDLVIPAGEASVSKAFDLTPTDDALDEAEETISVTGESGSLTVTGTSIALTDDDVPELSITAGSAVTEGTAAGFTLNADIAPAADLTVKLDVATTDSFATSGTTGSKNLTFRAGRTSETYTVATQADTTDEPDGSVTVNVKGGTDYAVDSSGDSASVDVNDDDATTVTLARAGSGGIAEAGGAVDITVTLGRTLVAGEGVTVPLAVTGATETTHYTLTLKGDGGTGVSLVTADPHSAQHPAVKIEGAEARTATLTLTAVANTDNASRTVSIAYGTSPRAPSSSGLSGGITTSGSASVPILDDDAMVSVAAASAAEGSAVVFTVTLPEVAPSGGVTVGYSTSDGRGNDDDETHQVATSADYTAAAANAKLTIAQGQRSGTISISTTQDTTYEGDHYFTLTLDSTDTFNLSDTAGAALGTITDAADRPAFAFSAASTDADEDDGTLTLTVEKTGTTLVAATVSYATTNGTATGGSDFTAIASTDLDFAASEASKTVSVSLTDDSADEAGEAFTVDLTAGAHAQLGGTSSHTINITDNDATTVKLAAPSTAIDEAGGTKTITVELGRALTGDETLDVPLTFSGTATFGADYTLAAPNSTPTGVTYSNLASTDLAESPPTIAFSGVSGAASSATVILTATSDTTDEGATESVTAGLGTLNASSGENLDGGASGSGTAAFNITDDDGTPTATLALTPTSIDEAGDDNATTVTATLSGPSSEAVTLTVAAAAVSPADSGDFTLTGATLTIAAGTTTSTGTVTVTAVDNEVDAPDRSVTISATASGGGVADPSAVTLTITDDDTRGVTVTGVSLTMDEADKAGTANTREDQASYTVVLDSEPTDGVRIDLTAPDMVTLSPTSLTFTRSNWNQTQTVTVTAVDDAIDNAGDARTGNITHAVVEGDSDYAGVAAAAVAVTVNDDDGTPVVTLELDPASIAESGDGNSTTVTASLSGASSQAITLTVAATAVSPAAAGDFTLSGTTLTIAAGATESTGTVTITAVDNDVDAANKTVTVSATATGGNGIANPADATLTITDDDDRGISVSPVALTLAEVDDPLTESATEHQKTYSVKLDSQPTGTVTVNLSSGDTTIAMLSDTSLEFTASDWDAQTVTVTAVDDAIDNAGDARTVRITHTVSAAGTDYRDETAAAVDVTVTDDDGEPTLSIDAPSIAEGNSATATLTFKVTLSPASGKPVTVAYADATTGTATSATDYAAITGGTLNFAVGDTEKTVAVTVNGDTTDEPNETVVLRLSSPSNAALSGGKTTLDGTGTINDDDATPTATLVLTPATIDESGNKNESTVTATLSGESSKAVTLTVAADAVSPAVAGDFTLSTNKTLTIAAGSRASTGAVTITAVDNSVDAPNKSVTVSATSSGGGVPWTRRTRPGRQTPARTRPATRWCSTANRPTTCASTSPHRPW